MAATRRITTQISDNVPAVFVTLRGKTYRWRPPPDGGAPSPASARHLHCAAASTHHSCSLGCVAARLRRLPGPLALVQTDIVRREGDHEITHINTLSLDAIAASCPLAHHDDAEDRSGGGLLTRVSRGSVSVRALAVVAVHEALLSGCPPRSPDRGVDDEEGAASERRTLQRAAARLTWGLAGLAYELMHSQAGHWPQLSDPVARQAVAGSLLTQLHG